MKDITSFERIVVAKHFPNGLTVNLTERAARYVWLSDRGSFGLDDQGQIVSHFNDASIRPEGLSTINDENNLPIEIGARVIKEETVKSISDFIKGLFEQNISFESISVPAISCPRTTVTNQNENDSIDGGVVINANASVNTNVNSELPQPLETDCDIPSLVASGQDFRVNTSDGWQIRFLANGDTSNQLTKLKRFLQDGSTDPKTLSYIDLRFGERIYYQ